MPVRRLNAAARRIALGAVRGLAGGVDSAFASTALSPGSGTRRTSSAEALGHPERMQALGLLAEYYDRAARGDPDGAFFPRPPPIAPKIASRRSLGKDGRVLDLSWPSTFEPLWSLDALAAAGSRVGPTGAAYLERIDRGASLRDKYLGVAPNMTAHARWFHHEGAVRPCVVLLHGYLGGPFLVEERLWPVRKLFDGGFDVVLSVLPFHGPRRDPRRGLRPPAFPSSDPRFTIEGMRQLVFDHRALFDFLCDGRVSSVGVMGMSLGGYGSALLATLEALEFAVLYIPLSAIDRFAHAHGRMVGDVEEQAAQAAALARVHSVVSPLSRAPRVAAERTIVIAGEADRVTGLDHAQALAQHFSARQVNFPGGHILQLGRDAAFGPVFEMLAQAGLYAPPR